MTAISFNVSNREFSLFKSLTTAQTIRNFMSIMAMLLLALTGGLTLSSCGQEDEPIHQDFPPVPQRVINLSALKAADLPDSTLTLYNGYTLTGTLNGEEETIKIQIAHGATITLDYDIIHVTAIKGVYACRPIGFSSYDENANICGNITFGMKQAYTAGDDPLCGYDYWPIDLYFEEQTTDLGDMDDEIPDIYDNNTWVYYTDSWFDYNP